jgi:hypothetical protein
MKVCSDIWKERTACNFRVNDLCPGGQNLLALKMGPLGFIKKQEPTFSTLCKNPNCEHYKRKAHKIFNWKLEETTGKGLCLE